MKRLLLFMALALISLNPEGVLAQGRDIRNLQNRLDKARDNPREKLKALAEAHLCKGEKKPICYAEALIVSKPWVLVRITRPESQNLFFVLLHQKPDGDWKAVAADHYEKLSADYFIGQNIRIPPKLATRMIQELNRR